MTKVTIPCDCDAEEHEVEVSAELGGYGACAHIGLYAPGLGELLPCGCGIGKNDLDYIIRRLEEFGVDEG